MAPLAGSFAASFAATVAVGVAMAIARAERERRAGRRRRAAERQFALLPGELPGDGLRRMALGQLDLAIDLLSRGRPDERAVHETRKAIKRLRALVRLLRHQLGEETFASENAALRDAGRRLAGARDAEVMVASLDRLIRAHPRRLGRRRGVKRLRRALERERRATAARALGDDAMRAQVLSELRAVRRRIEGWQLTGLPGIEALERDLGRIYRDGRRRMRRAARGKGDRARAMHEWRKRVKDLRYAAEMLERHDPLEHKNARRRRVREDPGARRLRRLARRADRLGEALGEEHDLAVLAQRVSAHGGGHRHGGERRGMGRGSRRALLKVIARRRRRLRSQTLREGARLYRRRPRRFLRRVRRAYDRASLSRR
ncbi:MAG TPA: CHAD domain-containing protein [Solirubrobacteraceae bacterium]